MRAMKQAQQREERAVGHDKRAATHAAAAAGKGRQLTTAQASLGRELGQQRKKDDAELRRRRDEELRHISRAISVGWKRPGARLRHLSWPIERSHPRRRRNDARR